MSRRSSNNLTKLTTKKEQTLAKPAKKKRARNPYSLELAGNENNVEMRADFKTIV